MALVARRSGRRRRLMAEINVVPYVDVMLVLVVILMVAVPFVMPSVVQLPTVDRASQQQDTPVRIVVRADGRVSIRDERGSETPIARGELVAAVRQRQRGDPTVPVVIEADQNVPYRAVMDAMRELQREVARVGLAVEPATPRR